MSRREACGAFDAFVHAVIGLGTNPTWTGLPPATVPSSLGRSLGQGVLQGRLPRGAYGACASGAPPLAAERIEQEGQRSVAELGAILWHALDGPRDAPELERWMAPPHADAVVALSISRRRLAEYAVPEAVDRSSAYPLPCVWLIEIERAKGDTPAGIAVWRSRGADGEWRTRCACIWTHGRIGSPTHPLVIGAQWGEDGSEAVGGACVVGPSWDDATRTAGDASRQAILARRHKAIGPQMMARIAIPAALAWLDAHGGVARPAGRFGAEARAAGVQRPRIVHPVRAPARAAPPAWLGATPERAVEAIVVRTAGEGWRVGASCAVPQWRDGWAGYAELGAVAWGAIDDLDRRIDCDTWSAMEEALREDRLANASAHPALEATSALVRKMLKQTGRNHVARAPDERTLCALEVPARLWRALREAGPCPEAAEPPELGARWWLVEIEYPADDEPNAIAIWEEDDAEVTLAAFLGVEDEHTPPCLTVVTWRTGADGARTGAGVAGLGDPIRVDNPNNHESQAGATRVIDTLAAPETGSVARAKTTITLHLANDGEPTPLGPYRASTAGAGPARQGAAATRRSFTALFALKRAPEPERGEDNATARSGHRHGGSARLLARQEVGPHWKRQAYGPRHSKRRWIVVERYERGPAPEEDQIVLTRLAERQPGGQAPGSALQLLSDSPNAACDAGNGGRIVRYVARLRMDSGVDGFDGTAT